MSEDNKDSGTQTPQSSQGPSPSPGIDTSSAGSQELAAAVDDLLNQLQKKFDSVSNEIFGKLDDMARRLDELEASLSVASEAAASTK
ncbi:heat shock factor binding protein 1-domain-containing protein [Thermoascus aurantiacus ATCC 26904]